MITIKHLSLAFCCFSLLGFASATTANSDFETGLSFLSTARLRVTVTVHSQPVYGASVAITDKPANVKCSPDPCPVLTTGPSLLTVTFTLEVPYGGVTEISVTAYGVSGFGAVTETVSLVAFATVDLEIDLCEDPDHDGICSFHDNCPNVSNRFQEDFDRDGLGDVCDPCPHDFYNDVDHDGICGDVDNRPNAANADQTDNDKDGVGDECDNCPAVSNPDQADRNNDGIGDACSCETDQDGDGDADGFDLARVGLGLSSVPVSVIAEEFGRVDCQMPWFKKDGLAKGRQMPFSVIPVETGIQGFQEVTNPLDPGSRFSPGQVSLGLGPGSDQVKCLYSGRKDFRMRLFLALK